LFVDSRKYIKHLDAKNPGNEVLAMMLGSFPFHSEKSSDDYFSFDFS